MLRQRIITAAILAAVFLGALFGLGTAAFGAVCLLALLAGVREWALLAGLDAGRAWLAAGAALGCGAALLWAGGAGAGTGLPGPVPAILCAIAALFWVLAAPAWLAAGWPTRRAWPVTLLGAALILAFWVALVQLHARSPWLLLGVMAVVWFADTGAYFSGRRWGRNKLAPSISPGKSWEGVYGGMTCVLLYAVLVALFSPLRERGGATAAAIVGGAAVLAAISVIGDLFESWLKRQAGVKDSGTLLPGHGGALDRIDALLPALPLATLFVMAMS
jgi:phosphatidate cytidylyltransferase